ncbi:MAG: hypothetical protein CUN55_08960 [Phototrophicales bacterium]|nr:MAG: hypothetical protein CUN55_08960 [Phototrophicales bacterium]
MKKIPSILILLLIASLLSSCAEGDNSVAVKGAGDPSLYIIQQAPTSTAEVPLPSPTAIAAVEVPPLAPITLNNAASLSVLTKLPAHEGQLLFADFLNDDQVITFGVDGKLNFWDTRGWVLTNTTQIFNNGILGALSADRSWAILIGDNNRMIRIRLNGSALNTEGEYVLLNTPTSISVAPDGRVAVGFERGELQIFSSDLSELLLTLTYGRPPNDTQAIAWNHDSSILVTGYPDSSIVVWDAASGERINRLREHSEGIQTLRSSPDGQFFISGDSSNSIFYWNFETLTVQQYVIRAHSRDVGDVAFHPTELMLATTGQDGTLRVWDWRTAGSETAVYVYEAGPTDSGFWTRTPAFSPNQNYLIISDDDGVLTVFIVAANAE